MEVLMGAVSDSKWSLLSVDLGTMFVWSKYIQVNLGLSCSSSFHSSKQSIQASAVRRLDIKDDRRLVCFGSRIQRLILTNGMHFWYLKNTIFVTDLFFRKLDLRRLISSKMQILWKYFFLCMELWLRRTRF